MFCRNCGKEIDDQAIVCIGCGVATETSSTRHTQPSIIINNANTNTIGGGYIHKSKWVAFFLCLFLGGIGAHRFYVGKIGTGVIWLLTLGFAGIGALVDLIVILCGNFRDKAGQPLV